MIVLRNFLFRRLSTLALAAIFAVSIQGACAESSKDAEQAGATLFRDKGCTYCHGANVQGTPKGPSLQQVRKTLKPQQIADQIKNGGQKMPSFEESLSSEEINQLVAYLRAKHRPLPGPLPGPLPVAPDTAKPATGPTD